MLNIETKELKISDKLKRKIDMIGRFKNTAPNINNGCVKNITGTNVAYIMPHNIVIKNNKYLMFDECDDVYVNTFKSKITFKVYKDAGISAKSEKRPAYQEMLEDIINKNINVIVAFKLDRLTRRVYDIEKLMKIVNDLDFEIIYFFFCFSLTFISFNILLILLFLFLIFIISEISKVTNTLKIVGILLIDIPQPPSGLFTTIIGFVILNK